jgi:phosphate butyryltransferase
VGGYQNFEQLIHTMSSDKKPCVVVAAAQDAHALEAVIGAHEKGKIDYLLVGDAEAIKKAADERGFSINPDRIVRAGSDQAAAAEAVRLIREEAGDFLMKGKLMSATLLKEVVNSETGIRTGSVISHIALLQIPSYHKLLAVTDGGMIPHPDVTQKVSITENAINFFNSIGYEKPHVAVLAAVEAENPQMPETGDAVKVMEHFRGRGNCVVQGPLSLDLALSRESAGIKGVSGPVIADADILITPDIASGNMLSKSMIYTGNAVMAGCIVGAKVPIVLTSRGASAQEKYLSLVIAAASCK